jgi:ABC-type sugar transport system ATPase subunit
VTVLRDGHFVGSEPASSLTPDAVIRMMVGRGVQEVTTKSITPGDVVLEVRGLSRRGVLDDVSFTVREHEIVTLAGLVGAGRSETANSIFGADRYDAGEVRVAGKLFSPGDPTEAIAAGIGYIPEERRRQALVGQLSVSANTTLAILDRIAPRGLINFGEEHAVTARAVRSLGIKAASTDVPVATLSGGNQQKVVLGRWLARKPRLLILDEPTKGIDVGAKAEISELIVRLAAEGTAILLISSEMPEVLALSDRVLVMRSGRIAGELSRGELSAEAVMHLATSG